ncbi:hypothetical protein ACOIDH_30050, partial [Klebsiella pneumoniae]|uniref:hypothetical protein n=1 Tax=Klebsiella pneumoniae TaxID=573 RepID=UPI003B5C09D9
NKRIPSGGLPKSCQNAAEGGEDRSQILRDESNCIRGQLLVICICYRRDSSDHKKFHAFLFTLAFI